MNGWLNAALTGLLAVLATGCLIPVPGPGWDDDDGHRDYRDRDGDHHRGDHRRWDRDRDHGDDRYDRYDRRDWRR